MANKQVYDSPQVKEDKKNTKEQSETDEILISHETQVDEKIQTPVELGKEDEIKESLQEQKGSEDIDISNDVDDEEMHAGGSNDNDEEVKKSVDDEKSDVSKQSDVKLKISEDLGKRKKTKKI